MRFFVAVFPTFCLEADIIYRQHFANRYTDSRKGCPYGVIIHNHQLRIANYELRIKTVKGGAFP